MDGAIYEMQKAEIVRAFKMLPNGNGALPHDIFVEIARVWYLIAFEAVLLRKGRNGIEVYLTQRDQNDPFYPKEWHAPGSILLPREAPDNVARRLGNKEFKNPITDSILVGHKFHQEARGWMLSMVFLTTVPDLSHAGGTWYPVNALPENTVSSHVKWIIPMAVAVFKRRHGWRAWFGKLLRLV